MLTFALDSRIKPKKLFFRELVSSLSKIKNSLPNKADKQIEKTDFGEKKALIAQTNPPQSRTRIGSIIPKDPKKVKGLLTSQEIRGMIKDSCSLIKTVDKDMVPGIERRVKRIYEGTSTPTTLQRYLEDKCDLEDWQAKRIVDDQMRKYEAKARLEAMKKKGVRYVRWVHGDSHEPRPWHVNHYPYGLAGKVFDINEPQLIDPEKGIYGYPGDLIGCSCRLVAVR